MTISIVALGSRGDIQPYIALGHGLVKAGHKVRMATFGAFEKMARDHGLDFYQVPGDTETLLKMAFDNGFDQPANILNQMKALRESYATLSEDYVRAFRDPIFEDSQVILNQLPGSLFGDAIAEKYCIPHLAVSVIPLQPTRHFPLVLLTSRNLGGFLNRASYEVASLALKRLFGAASHQLRKALNLPSRPMRASVPLPVINGFSPRVIPIPPDWGSHVHTTSWWTLPIGDWSPPDDLAAFLNAGEPPVFIGFGSMIAKDPAGVTRLLIESVQKTGMRAVLSRGWAQLGSDDLPAHIHAVDYAPYEWLFPRTAAIVHHGGSGTTGAALRSGVPSMVVPFLADQPYWGKRTAALKAGLPPLPFKSLTASSLAQSISVLTSDPALKQNAAALGAKLRAEDGIGMAINVIERYLQPT
jgi:UDP:flavonoid glycosyltransferase YjiC (YdhE family)